MAENQPLWVTLTKGQCLPISMGMLTPEQCRAARGLLDWTQEQLATRAGVSRSTIRGFENGQHELHRGSATVIQNALEVGGVMLIDPDDAYGPGVRLRHTVYR